jgi:benzoate-CoA ligase
MEQRVLLMVGDWPDFVPAWFAAVKIGAVVAAVNPEVKPEEAEYYLNYTRARAAVVQASALPAVRAVRERCPYLKTVFIVCAPGEIEPGPGEVLFAKAVGEAPNQLDPAPTHRDDAAVWLFTSGSTGFPKAAVHRHRDFFYSAETYGVPILKLVPDDVCASVPKLFFGYALGNNLLFPFRVGATCVLFPERSSAERVLEVVTKHKVTALCNVPTAVNAMVNLEDVKAYDWSRLRVATSAGEALPVELHRRWNERFGVELLDGIGSAEMFHVFVSNRLGEIVPGSLGQAVPGYEVKLMDDEGCEVPDGDIGTLWVKGGSISMGYWNRREVSLETFRGEWCVTADKFVRDAKGYYWYRGRSDDLLKVGGRYVAPVEIENCLLQHPAVLEAAVIGYKDEEQLEKPRAYVVLKAGHVAGPALAMELQAFVKGKIQPFKYPRDVRFIDALPKSDRGKVLKTKLVE